MSPPASRSDRGRAAQRLGRLAEGWCRAWLRLKGYRILACRHAARRGSGAGEIDIVARRGDLVAFVEVKARATRSLAAEAVTAAQRRRLMRGADAFLAGRPDLANCRIRFDVMLVARWRWPCHLADAWRVP
jgi:putative endonuclease